MDTIFDVAIDFFHDCSVNGFIVLPTIFAMFKLGHGPYNQLAGWCQHAEARLKYECTTRVHNAVGPNALLIQL